MRKSGILLPITSLPSPHGVGTLGREAFTFVDFLARAGQSYWQILPVGPVGYGNSPYQCYSAFAGNHLLIDLDLLRGEGLLTDQEIGGDWGDDPSLVDYEKLDARRLAVLATACARMDHAAPAYRAFCRENADWLDDYALFMALKEAGGGQAFSTWPEPLRLRQPKALKAAMAQHAPRVEFWRRLQYLFFCQWAALKSYANACGVGLVGDIPIYVSGDSSDLWANPALFQLDENGAPSRVAGVPPDAFSDDGQLWGNPLYDWKEHKRTRYAWWLARLRQSATLFDVTRIDHFRGFSAYYAVPAGDETARRGRWLKGPGTGFIRAVQKALPDMGIIAEDLGFLTAEVRELLAASGYPGMKVLQFAFDSREESDYLPHNYPRHTVVYTGTHDNTTTTAWAKEAKRADVAFARRYLGLSPRGDLCAAMVRAALQSVADTAIIPMQDWLGLGPEARINTPSTLGGRNWRWRLAPGQLTPELAAGIRLATRTYGRLSDTEREKDRYAHRLATAATADGAILHSAISKAADKKMSMNPTRDELAAAGEPAPEGAARPRVLTAAQMKAAEAAAAAAGTSYEALMENAGIAAAGAIEALAAKAGLKKEMLLLCGKGNNAGDAFVVARLLAAKGWRCRLLCLCGSAFSPLAAQNLFRLPKGLVLPGAKAANFGVAVLVDGVFGTGFHGELPAPVQAAFARANAARGLRVALDVPSGMDCDTGRVSENTFRAAHTLTFGAYKPALLMPESAPYTGAVQCLDIGL